MKYRTLSLLIALLLLLATANSYAAFPVKTHTEHTAVVVTNEAGHHVKKQAFRARAKQYFSEHVARWVHRNDPNPSQSNKRGWPGPLSFIFGILAFVCLASIVLALLFIPFSIAALVIGIIGLNRRYKNQGFAIAGLVLGATGIVLTAIIIAVIASISTL